MKVLFHAYNTCCQNTSGGVQVRIRKIKKLLEEKGIQVDYFCPFDTKVIDYDVLHVFSLNEESLGLVKTAKNLGLKVVISTIVNTTPFRAKSIRNSLAFPRIMQHFGLLLTEYDRYQILKYCDYLFVESKTEADFISKYYKINMSKIRIVPNGVDEPRPADKSIFKTIGKECNYVLQVGRVDANKNLLRTIKAVRGASYDLVVIGGKSTWGTNSYYDNCVYEANISENVHMLGWLDRESSLLASAFQNAQVVILPSLSETFGLVAVEAAMYGANVCLSNNLPILDFNVFKKDFTFNPTDISDMRRVLDYAMSTPKSQDVKDLARTIFSWDTIIREHIKTYNQ